MSESTSQSLNVAPEAEVHADTYKLYISLTQLPDLLLSMRDKLSHGQFAEAAKLLQGQLPDIDSEAFQYLPDAEISETDFDMKIQFPIPDEMVEGLSQAVSQQVGMSLVNQSHYDRLNRQARYVDGMAV